MEKWIKKYDGPHWVPVPKQERPRKPTGDKILVRKMRGLWKRHRELGGWTTPTFSLRYWRRRHLWDKWLTLQDKWNELIHEQDDWEDKWNGSH